MRDADTVFDRTLAEIKQLTNEGLAPDGVCTFNEMARAHSGVKRAKGKRAGGQL